MVSSRVAQKRSRARIPCCLGLFIVYGASRSRSRRSRPTGWPSVLPLAALALVLGVVVTPPTSPRRPRAHTDQNFLRACLLLLLREQPTRGYDLVRRLPVLRRRRAATASPFHLTLESNPTVTVHTRYDM